MITFYQLLEGLGRIYIYYMGKGHAIFATKLGESHENQEACRGEIILTFVHILYIQLVFYPFGEGYGLWQGKGHEIVHCF